MNEVELEARRLIFEAFAASAAPPEGLEARVLRSLAEQHVVVLDADGRIVMAHPFAAPGAACRVDAGGRSWWGSCAWDGLGIAAALGLEGATVTAGGVEATDDVLFHVAVPGRAWWDDIAFT